MADMASVLIEEDEALLRGLFRCLLKRGGFEVREAASGEEVLAQYRTSPSDVVIVDLPMPNREGLATIWTMAREFPGVKIIAISGEEEVLDSLDMAKAVGAKRTMQKPFAIEDLVRTVRELRNGAYAPQWTC